MHELTLAERAIALAENAARRAGARRITRIRLAVGVLSHVDGDTLAYCCGLVRAGTLAEDAAIEVERIAGQASCRACGQELALARAGEPCPRCGSFDLDVTDGDQMQILDIGVE